MKTAFIGHRLLFAKNIEKKLYIAIEKEIKRGCKTFTMGTHGEFDNLALCICKRLRQTYPDLKIEVVITSLNTIKKNQEFDFSPYVDVNTVMYEIENVHFKQKITFSNCQMLRSCDSLICYVDTSAHRSGAKKALKYAENQGLKIVNLYSEKDSIFYGMTNEDIASLIEKTFTKKE